jgi:DNA-binding MarR family transcriptional regulator
MEKEKEHQNQKEIGELIKLIGRRWHILLKLSKVEKSYMGELSKELGKRIQQIHYELKELEERGLVKSERDPKEKRKYYSLTEYADRILYTLNQAFQSVPMRKIEQWQIDMLLNVLEDRSLSDNLRLYYSKSFRAVCSNYPIEVISYQRARMLFERILANKSEDKVMEDLKRCISAILPHASHHREWGKWVLERIYPVLLEYMKDGNEENRKWAMAKIQDIAFNTTDPSIKNEFEEKLLELWFSKDTDPNSNFGIEIQSNLQLFFSKRLFEKVRERARHKEEKEKAEILLERLAECLKV